MNTWVASKNAMKSISIGNLDLNLKDIALDFGLHIKSFHITAQDGSADIEPFKLNLPNPGKLIAKVTEDAVAKFLEKKSPSNFSDFQVTIANDHIYVDATANIVLSFPIKAACQLEIVDDTQLFVKIISVDVMGGKAKNLVEAQLQKINPIIDADEVPLEIKFTEVHASDGEITLEGVVLG